ncbi:hypothetical protein ACOWPH_29120 (plasmid) [Anabaena sp. PCC 7938]|uniref:hypothetical protein n=1 Tax=Anabaena sp. PCC 7938 TaxID=1296340 RepID=UPI003BEF0765
MTKKQPPLATFRCDEQLWQDFKDLCSKNNTNASAALIAFVKQSVASGNLDINAQAYRQITPTQSILLNLDDIYKYIDNRLDNIDAQSRRDTDTQISTQNLEELIDSRILLSVLNGDIKEANARSYSQATTNLNSTRKEFYSKVEELEKQLEELKSNPPVAVAVPLIPQSPITSEEFTRNYLTCCSSKSPIT